MQVPEPTHLSPKAREALSLPLEERVAYAFEDRWVGYPEAKRALDAMALLVARPRTTNMPCMMLLGRPGNGKSMILQRFAALNPPTIRAEGGVTGPVVLMEQSAGASESVFWSDLLFACATAHRDSDPVLRKRTQALSVLGTLQVRALAIDELHNIGHGLPKPQRQLLDAIKSLTNTMRAPIIAAGTEDANRLIDTDEQMFRRFRTFELPKWEYNADFRRLLASFERVLPLARPSDLKADELSARIYDRSEGSIGEVAETLKQAAALAIRSGQERIDAATVAQVPSNTREARLRRIKRL